MQVQSSKTSGNRNLVSGFLRLLVLSLLTAAFAFTSLHAQTVAYVTNAFDNTVSVINTSTNTVTATIPVGFFPLGVVISPDGARAYVTNAGDCDISVIDTASNTAIATVGLGDTEPGFPAITPDGKSLYIPDVFRGNVLVLSTSTNTVTATIPMSSGPFAVAITPDGSRAYVLGGGNVTVVDTATNTVVGGPISVPTGQVEGVLLYPGIAITPAGNAAYVPAGSSANVLTAISTATNTVSATIPAGAEPAGLAITLDGSKVYVTDFRNNAVSIIDTATNTLEPSSIPVGVNPFGAAITPDGAFVYVTNAEFFSSASSTVSVISTANNTVVATVPVGNESFGIAIANRNAPFASFPAPTPGNVGNPNRISLSGSLSLGANSPGLDFAHQPMTLTVGGFSLLFPAGTVTQVGNGSQQHFTFSGTLNGLSVTFDLIGNSPNFSYSVTIQGKNVKAQVGPNPVTVTLAIGSNSGSSTVNF